MYHSGNFNYFAVCGTSACGFYVDYGKQNILFFILFKLWKSNQVAPLSSFDLAQDKFGEG